MNYSAVYTAKPLAVGNVYSRPPPWELWLCSLYVPSTCAQHEQENALPSSCINAVLHRLGAYSIWQAQQEWQERKKWNHQCCNSELDKKLLCCWINKGHLKWNKIHNDLCHTGSNISKSCQCSPERRNGVRLITELWKTNAIIFNSKSQMLPRQTVVIQMTWTFI